MGRTLYVGDPYKQCLHKIDQRQCAFMFNINNHSSNVKHQKILLFVC